MTTRLKGVLVMFEQDIREDDAEQTINALRQIRGVLDVQPIPTDGFADAIAEERARRLLIDKLYGVLYPKGPQR